MSIYHLPPRLNAVDNMQGPERVGNTVIIDGRAIPKLHMHDNGDEVEFVLDGRLAFGFPREWAYLAATFAANAMAIGSGYSFIGAETRERPFAPKCGPLNAHLNPVDKGED